MTNAGLTEAGVASALKSVSEGWSPWFAASQAAGLAGGCAPGQSPASVRGKVETILSTSATHATDSSTVVEQFTGQSSPAIDAARQRLVEARTRRMPLERRAGGSNAVWERVRRGSAETFAEGAVEAVLELAIRHGASESDIVARIDEIASAQMTGARR